MEEILPGVFHWTAVHPRIRIPVHSHFLREDATLLDPMLPPDEGIDWFEENGRPEQIVLTIRHHWRESERFVDEFGCRVLCHRAGLHEFEDDDRDVEGFEFGDRLAPRVTAQEVDAISPDDAALHIEVDAGVLAFADGIIHMGEDIGFVPDAYMDEPEETKRGIVAAVGRLLDLEFDHLLFAHGDPIVGGGKAALERFVEERGG
jgi:hypothetical protein